MSMSSPEMRHKVRHLDNDVQAIYVMLADIQATQGRHSNRLQELAELLIGHDRQFETVGSRLESIDTHLAGHDSRLDSIDGKLDTVLEILRDRT
jgi:hypothetical protein